MEPAESKYLQQIGNRIRRLRKVIGLSQEKLADECGLDRTYVGGIERGERNVTILKLKLVAQKLKVNIREFFDDTGY